ncbi:MAG: HPr family phosphocarrier protein [Sinobacterium sp.]|jgi:phosphocarrier protein|tara:strand:+ start:83 stop:352 length:270 start_codon:yes stop_codon:yes gene_type:complete
MITTQLTIINKYGLHARAAAKFVSAASAFQAEIKVGRDDKLVDAKSIMSVMMLAASIGTVLNFEINGHDEEQALDAIDQLIKNRFDEEE